jgi:hypothetical protein
VCIDCALHDMTRDKPGVECYLSAPAIRKEALATKHQANGPTSTGGNVRHPQCQNKNFEGPAQREHLKRGTAPQFFSRGVGVGTRPKPSASFEARSAPRSYPTGGREGGSAGP